MQERAQNELLREITISPVGLEGLLGPPPAAKGKPRMQSGATKCVLRACL